MKNIFKIDIDEGRVYGLDILRCLAILWVVIGHGNILLPERVSRYINYILFDGVAFFFVLSGFLIGGILAKTLEKKGASFKALLNFWVRRWFRTLPTYFLVLILLSGLWLTVSDNFTLRSINRYFFFSQNLFSRHPDWFFPEAWSLSVEEWFYLLVPISIFSLAGMNILTNKRAILFTAVFILVTVTSFRLYRYHNMPLTNIDDWDLVFRKQVFTRLDSLMYGVIGAYVAFYYKAKWLRFKHSMLFIGIGTLLVQQYFPFEPGSGMYLCTFSFSVTSCATLFLLPFLSDYKHGKGMLFTAITYISLISYSMYLLHLSVVLGWVMYLLHLILVQVKALRLIDLTSLYPYFYIIKYMLYWISTIAFSILLYKFYEMPMTGLRDKKK